VFAQVILEPHGYFFGEATVESPVVSAGGKKFAAPLLPVSINQLPFFILEMFDFALDTDQASPGFLPVFLKPVGVLQPWLIVVRKSHNLTD